MNGKGDYFMELLLQKYAFYVNCNFKIHCEIVNWTSKKVKFSYFENSCQHLVSWNLNLNEYSVLFVQNLLYHWIEKFQFRKKWNEKNFLEPFIVITLISTFFFWPTWVSFWFFLFKVFFKIFFDFYCFLWGSCILARNN